MSIFTVLLVDTSYLCEIYKVPGFFDDAASAIIRKKLEAAIIASSVDIFVTIPTIYELMNHVSQLPHGGLRRQFAERVRDDVRSSLAESMPWAITPPCGRETVLAICDVFASEFAEQGIGLTDSTTISEARRLKDDYQKRGRQVVVHIWTRDGALKAREPDSEPNPFV